MIGSTGTGRSRRYCFLRWRFMQRPLVDEASGGEPRRAVGPICRKGRATRRVAEAWVLSELELFGTSSLPGREELPGRTTEEGVARRQHFSET